VEDYHSHNLNNKGDILQEINNTIMVEVRAVVIQKHMEIEDVIKLKIYFIINL
jgi:hypothetical protein